MPINKNYLLIAYKLLNDILFILLAFFVLALIGDGIISGIVTNHLSFLKLMFLIIGNIAAIYILGSFSQIKFNSSKSTRKISFFLYILAGFLILNSLLKLNSILAIFILAFSLITGYFLYRNILEEK